MKGALSISRSPELSPNCVAVPPDAVNPRRYLLDSKGWGVGGGEPYSKPSQQVEEAEVTGARAHVCTPMVL